MPKFKMKTNNGLGKVLGQVEVTDKKSKKYKVIEINVKTHKGDKAELASTIKHEMMHVAHPKMHEKTVYKKTAKTKILPSEQKRLLAQFHKTKGKNV